jgi:AraC-like DNA-binding protein
MTTDSGRTPPAGGWRSDPDLVYDGYNSRVAILSPLATTRALGRPLTERLVVTTLGFGRGHRFDYPSGVDSLVVHLCVSGEGWVRVDGTTHVVRTGDAMVLPPHTPASYGPRPDPWSSWWFVTTGADVAEFVRAMGVSREHPVVPLRTMERMVALVDEIMTSYERDQSPARVLQATGAAWKILTQLAVDRLIPERGDPLARAMEYLANRLDGDVQVPELAALVGLSPSRLTTLFREATGGGVLAYQIGLRMARARRLLDTTGASVTEIAREVGYHDPYYFSRHFRRLHGMSPREFRQRHRGRAGPE